MPLREFKKTAAQTRRFIGDEMRRRQDMQGTRIDYEATDPRNAPRRLQEQQHRHERDMEAKKGLEGWEARRADERNLDAVSRGAIADPRAQMWRTEQGGQQAQLLRPELYGGSGGQPGGRGGAASQRTKVDPVAVYAQMEAEVADLDLDPEAHGPAVLEAFHQRMADLGAPVIQQGAPPPPSGPEVHAQERGRHFEQEQAGVGAFETTPEGAGYGGRTFTDQPRRQPQEQQQARPGPGQPGESLGLLNLRAWDEAGAPQPQGRQQAPAPGRGVVGDQLPEPEEAAQKPTGPERVLQRYFPEPLPPEDLTTLQEVSRKSHESGVQFWESLGDAVGKLSVVGRGVGLGQQAIGALAEPLIDVISQHYQGPGSGGWDRIRAYNELRKVLPKETQKDEIEEMIRQAELRIKG